ncbi:MAG: ABC transporter substrate-binding protein [Deferrisomatales bacterium]
MNRPARRGGAALLALVALLAAGCSPAPAPAPREAVAVQLKWFHQAQFAGFYLARERGHYAAEGLEVALLPGGPGVDVIGEVTAGRAAYGVAAPEDVLTRRSQGAAVAAIAALYRRNPLVFLTLPGSGIGGPEGFPGRTISFPGADGRLQFQALMSRLGLDPGAATEVPYQYDYTSLLAGETAVTVGYVTGGVLRLRRQGREVNLIWPDDYGLHLYGDVLVAADAEAAAHPDRVTRFLRATLRGWREAVEDPAAAVDATLRYAKEPDRDLQARMMEASVPLVHTGEDRIGWMRTAVWEETHRLLAAQGVLAGPVDPASAYTLAFLERVYGGPR